MQMAQTNDDFPVPLGNFQRKLTLIICRPFHPKTTNKQRREKQSKAKPLTIRTKYQIKTGSWFNDGVRIGHKVPDFHLDDRAGAIFSV